MWYQKCCKLLLCLLVFAGILGFSHATYTPEFAVQQLMHDLRFPNKNLSQPISRREFLETLAIWYPLYKKQKGITVDITAYPKIDNTKYFVDVDLTSEFGKILSYFAHIGAVSKREKFNPNNIFTQEHFFIVMQNLKILFGKKNCVYHKICEKEISSNTQFLKGTYYSYVSKILDKSLRKYYVDPSDYWKEGYRPLLSPRYHFPLKRQSLNACYFFSVRNILKFKYGIGVYISRTDNALGRNTSALTSDAIQNRFDALVHVTKEYKTDVDTLITSLQKGDPVAISYILHYKGKSYPHVAVAYSFDEDGVRVAETVTNRYVHVSYDEFLSKSGKTRYRPFRLYYYRPQYTWTAEELNNEKQNNFLAQER